VPLTKPAPTKEIQAEIDYFKELVESLTPPRQLSNYRVVTPPKFQK
jgi:hypothetical protein